MKTDSEKLIENDAASMPARSTELTNYNSRNEIVDISPTQNNNMVVANQTNTQAVVTFENCNNITLGTVFNVGYSPGNSNLSFQESTGGYAPNMQEDRAYKKTPTIKEMMRCNDPISDAFLEYVSGNFGSKWKDFTIFLGINQLYVERMYEDYYERFGTKEVMFRVLSKFFKDFEDKANVGWLTTTLWRNGFKQTVWTVKNQWKIIRDLEQ